jgi:N utilization substance protein B
MADSTNGGTPKNTPGRNPKSATKPARKRSGKARNAPDKRQSVAIDRRAPLHQSRVLAMQALYEDDISAHGLDDILQHVGVSRRKDLETWFTEAERKGTKAVETIGYLARNAERDASGAPLDEYHAATTRVINNLTESGESADTDTTDSYIALVQGRVDTLVASALESFRERAATLIQTSDLHQAKPLDDDEDEGEQREPDALARLEYETLRLVRDTYIREERESLATLLEMLKRTERIARGVQAKSADIDPHIERAAPAFPIPQLASIDRAVLRIAVFEILFEDDVPFRVAINEAVDIAKHYGGPNSGRFVNGVLRTISERLPSATA